MQLVPLIEIALIFCGGAAGVPERFVFLRESVFVEWQLVERLAASPCFRRCAAPRCVNDADWNVAIEMKIAGKVEGYRGEFDDRLRRAHCPVTYDLVHWRR